MIEDVINIIRRLRVDLTNEKNTQEQIHSAIKHLGFGREYKLDAGNIPDLYFDGIAIEVKIKGSKISIYRHNGLSARA